jgi:Carboxypeptidase regulatory-like domain
MVRLKMGKRASHRLQNIPRAKDCSLETPRLHARSTRFSSTRLLSIIPSGIYNLFVLSAIFLAAGSILLAYGQATSGSITGFVADNTGAAIPQAKVSVIGEGTGVVTEATTDGAGFYNVTHIIAGDYTVKVTANGFKTFSKQHIRLQVDTTVSANARLEPGMVTEQVIVSAAPAELKTEKTDVDHLLDQHDLETIPVVDDNLTSLYTTAPGVVPFSFQISTNENPSEGFMSSANGQLWMANDYQVNGITDIAWGFTGLQIIVPPSDSVEALKITTADYDPEYGNVGGLVAQWDTKSGTNSYHGSAYWMNRNSWSFAANPFTEKIPGTGPEGNGTGVAPYNENIGGFALGGPIKRDKIFFFADYRLNRRLVGANLLTTVPNDAFRAGDFSSVATTNPIYDPTTGNPDGSGRTQFANNTIPAGRINQVATNLIALLPHANVSQATQNNYLGSGTSNFSTDEIDERVDWNFSDKDKIFESYSYMWSLFANPSVFGVEAGGPSIAGGNASTAHSWNQLLSINYTHAFTPTFLAELRGGFARFYLNEYQNDVGLETNDKVGIPNINDGTTITDGVAAIEVAGPVGSFAMGTQGSVPRLDRSTVFQIVNNWTKVKGNHEIRWGVDWRKNLEDLFTLNQSTRGEFDFNQTVTGTAELPDSGIAMASFLLGGAGSFERGQFVIWPDERALRVSGYGGDVWKVTPKFTANYGLRWDYISPISPKNPGGDVNYDFTNGSLILAGLGPISNYSNVQPRYNNFAPRLGFAYSITQNTVVRGGLGRSYFINGFDAAFNHLDSSYPVAQAQAVDQSSLYDPIFPMNQGPPTPQAPVFPSSGVIPASEVPANDFAKAFLPERKTSSVDSWNLSIQQQLGKNTTVTLAYVGNKGNNLDYSLYNTDAAPPAPGDLLSRRPLYMQFGFTGQMYVNCTCDDSNYNSLQISGTRHFTNGYSFNSAFTYSKALDDEIGNRGPQGGNPYDIKGSYGVSYLNQAVVWTTTHSVVVPYGKGQRYGGNAGVIAQTLLGGWTFDGLTSLQSGLALSPTDSDSSTLNADFSQRPNRVQGTPLYPKGQNRNMWLNPAAFVTPPVCCVWGNAHPGTMRGPGYFDLDWSLGKIFTFKTPLNEATNLQFRTEAFNLLNHTNLGSPVNDINNPQYGLITSIAGNMRNLQFELHLRW